MSTINIKPDSSNKISISEDKKQLSITNPNTNNTINITTGETKIVNVTALGPQGQVGPEGSIGNVGSGDSLNLLHITASGVVQVGNLDGASVAVGNLRVKSDSNHKAIMIEENSGNEAYHMGVNAGGTFQIFNSGDSNPNFVSPVSFC